MNIVNSLWPRMSQSKMADSTKPKVVHREPTAFQNFIAGGVGGIAVVVIGHPFDTVKVRSIVLVGLAWRACLCIPL